MPDDEALATARGRRLTWRTGAKRPFTARLAARRVVVVDGPPNAGGQHLPGEAGWPAGKRRETGQRTHYLTSHPP